MDMICTIVLILQRPQEKHASFSVCKLFGMPCFYSVDTILPGTYLFNPLSCTISLASQRDGTLTEDPYELLPTSNLGLCLVSNCCC